MMAYPQVKPCPECQEPIGIHAIECSKCDWRLRKKSIGLWTGIASAYSYLVTPRKGPYSLLDQVHMYFGLMLGVAFSNRLRGAEGEGTVIAAALVALVIAPVAYEKLKISPEAPFLVRFGLFVQNGVFWDILFESIGTKISN